MGTGENAPANDAAESGAPALYRTGCAIWGLRSWIGGFYPTGARLSDALELYSRRLTAVEGNTTFYAMPSPEVIDRWAAQTPETFHFCPKLPRTVTHVGDLAPRVGEVRRFVERCARLGRSRVGPLFGLLPAEYGPERVGDLERFLDGWSRVAEASGSLQPELALEIRCPRWYTPADSARLNSLLHARGVGRVLLDTRPVYGGPGDPQEHHPHRKPKLPVSLAVTAGFTFVRFIAHPQPEITGRYLAQWVPRVRDWLERGVRVYFFAHCPDDTHSPDIARRLHRALLAAGARVEPLPWDDVPAESQQLALV